IFPFDLIPRAVAAREWAKVDEALVQRVAALTAFLDDVYGPQKALEDGIIPREYVEGSAGFCREMIGVKVPGGVRVHIAGIDLVRGPDGAFVVLEDNIRTPSGVSYVLQNRAMMKRVYPGLFSTAQVASVDAYPSMLASALRTISPRPAEETRVAILTPGPHNSAYFEHSFLARRAGVDLVQGQDLFVVDDRVYVKTTQGPCQIDVIYRRVDDGFLDPRVFRPDSLLGVPGLFGAYTAGNVALANAIGNGVADDKAVYPFVPDLVRYYLGEEPKIGQVPTYICMRDDDRAYVLEHLDSLVVKSVDESGGYGMLMGHQATAAERDEFAERIRANPRKYIAQPLVERSTCPVWTGEHVVARRVDLRPYIVTGTDGSWVLPGGLTRVALTEGSYVVNSSQGGGSKDTWIVEVPQ
ncbi:MAG: circularly permuted type 2 ATP-grasp protein, partial [Phycisphaerales bacterium]|nr:circularly permuted type 2 ATP-grasp protein [Phycisphaerales bacterium]